LTKHAVKENFSRSESWPWLHAFTSDS